MTFLRLKTERRNRTSLQAGQRNRLAGFLAIAVLVIIQTLQRAVDFRNQLTLTVTGAQFQRVIRLCGGAISQIGFLQLRPL